MQSNSLAHILLYFFVCGTSGYTTRKVRNICAVVVLTGFNDDQIAIHTLSLPFNNLYLCLRLRQDMQSSSLRHRFSCACLKTLASVLGCKSSFKCPGTVTRPGFFGCLYCR